MRKQPQLDHAAARSRMRRLDKHFLQDVLSENPRRLSSARDHRPSRRHKARTSGETGWRSASITPHSVPLDPWGSGTAAVKVGHELLELAILVPSGFRLRNSSARPAASFSAKALLADARPEENFGHPRVRYRLLRREHNLLLSLPRLLTPRDLGMPETHIRQRELP